MLSLASGVRVFVGVEPVDMRGSFDALAGAARRLGLEPVDGNLYLFFNRRRRLCKMIWFDGSGWCLFSKRLVIRYYRNHWDALFRFVHHSEIPIDNSASEREFQHVAKLRLNSLFAGSTEGAHRAATLLGITATCRSIGVDPLGYLGWALTRLGTHRDVFALPASEITPAAYARARDG